MISSVIKQRGLDFYEKFNHFTKITTLYVKLMQSFLIDSEEGTCTEKL